MGLHITRSELYDLAGGEDRVLRLFMRDVEASAVDGLIDSAIDTAEGEARSYLSGRYGSSLPSTPEATPAALKSAIGTLAEYVLAKRSRDLVSDELVRRRAESIHWLRDVARGVADLGLASAPPEDSTVSEVLIARDPSRDRGAYPMNRDRDLRDWVL